MSRLMSVAMTTDAVIERRKTVTRRKGWTFLKVGDNLTLCRKVQGRKPGEPIERLAEVEVVSVDRESLEWLAFAHSSTSDSLYLEACREVEMEGFPDMHPAEFVRRFFVEAQGMDPSDGVTRIEWRYLDDCEPCAEGARCDDCGERMCADFGPEPRACGTTCADCPCDCSACMDVRADLAMELTWQVERERDAS